VLVAGVPMSRELIGDRGFERTVTLDIKKHEMPNPKTKSGTTTVRCRRPCG
jgi:hypothetical protein